MTGRLDDGYRSRDSSEQPVEGGDEGRGLSHDFDGGAGIDAEGEVSRSSKRFRAWGAAHSEAAPSLWERLVTWLRGLFGRGERHDQVPLRHLPAAETHEAMPVADDFAEYARLIPKAETAASHDAAGARSNTFETDPLWDEPTVASAPAAAPPALRADEFNEVWAPRTVEPFEALVRVPEPQPDEPKPGFFGRLFSRKTNPVDEKEQEVLEEWVARTSGERAAQAAQPTDADFADDLDAAAPPDDSDFADNLEASASPSDSDFADTSSYDNPEPEAVEADEDPGLTLPTGVHPVANPLPSSRPIEDELESTQPIAATPHPGFDQDEKTDEFEAVPPPSRLDATSETRQLAGFWGRMFGNQVEAAAADARPSGPAATQAAIDEKIPFVLAKFRAFYNEIIREKHQKSDVISGFATAVMGTTSASEEADPEYAAALVSKRLSEMLELQAAESNWTGGDAAKFYPEAQYAMVALADETFATIDWPGRAAWSKHMLEPRLYGTRGADIEFFKRIDRLLKDPHPEKGARDLARLYLMVIASGYRGKFRVPNVRRPLAEYRRRLYEFSHQADPLELYSRERRIFPAAVKHTLASQAIGRYTSAQKWAVTVLVLVVLYLGFSHVAWLQLSADLKDIMSRIETSDSTVRTP